MPYIITGEPLSWKNSFISGDYNYDYPEGLNLRPDSPLHTKLRNNIWQRARASRNEMQKRFSYWREIDRTLTTYVDLSESEKTLKQKDPTKPLTIVFPYTYSMLEALLTYLSLAFFQEPMFQYEGVEDSDVIGAMLMEMVIKLHCIKNKVTLPIHTVLRDSLCYGIGVAVPEWRQLYGKRPIKSTATTISDLGENTTNIVEMINDLLFEGNALSNIDPYMYLPDPSVSSIDIQKAEYVGWVERTNYLRLLEDENSPNSNLFNVRYLNDKKDKRSTLALDQSDRQLRHGGSNDFTRGMSNTLNHVDVIKMYVTLIPKEWELSDYEYPEKWYFELASDDVIIACEKADHNHGLYPISISSPEFDGYSPTPIGRLEVLYGLQHTLDFLFSSHITNVRKAINDILIVDPYLVNIEDLKDPQPGKLVRLRRPAWGRGVDKVVQQLGITDITRANISDAAYITQWMDRISGADQSMQGSLRMSGPERLTSGEFQGTRSSAISRLQRIAMLIGTQFMQDVGTMFATHTQQYMSQDTYVKIVGKYEEQLHSVFGDKKRIRVTPYDLAINYDLIVRDGSIPGGNFSQSWIELFKIIGTNPELMSQFDVTRIFMYIANQLGAKNVEDFRRSVDNINTKVLPNDVVSNQARTGNFVPVEEL